MQQCPRCGVPMSAKVRHVTDLIGEDEIAEVPTGEWECGNCEMELTLKGGASYAEAQLRLAF